MALKYCQEHDQNQRDVNVFEVYASVSIHS